MSDHQIGAHHDRSLISAELCVLNAVEKEQRAKNHDRQMYSTVLQQPRKRPDRIPRNPDIKMGAIPNGDDRSDHDDPNKQEGCVFWINDLETKKPVTELVNGVGLWRANAITDLPIQAFLEPRPDTGQGYTVVPIRVTNKMGSH